MKRPQVVIGVCAGLAALVLLASPAGAGFILDTVQVELPQGPGQGHHGPPPWAQCPDWVREMVENRLRLRLMERFLAPDPLPVVISGETDEDPIMHISKDVENSSGVTWTGYEVEIDGTGATFVGPATSSHFQTATVTPLKITYEAPDPVLPGETVTLDFDIEVGTTGFFSFTLTQTPVPEPATLALLGAGAAGMVLLRRRRS